MFYLLYNLLSIFLLIPLVLFTLFRAIKLKWPLAILPRFGLIPARELAKIRGRQVILIHAVSVGEVIAARVLMSALKERYPDHALVVSCGTETGRQTALGFREVDLCIYLPFDYLFSVRLMLSRIEPCMAIVMETEIWPNFTHEIAARGIPLVLANGRISDRSFGRYLKLRWFFRHALQNFSLLCMQSDLMRERIIAIGAPKERAVVAGNLKLDIQPRVTTEADKQSLRQSYLIPQDCLVLTAGSTHPGEESLLLEIYREILESDGKIFLVLAPRHPQRADEVASVVENADIPFRRLTEQAGDESMRCGEILLVDKVGELMNLYALADIGFVGGSMVPKGGHNLLEPASCGLPVVFGQQMANFREIATLVNACQAGVQVADAAELGAVLRRLVQDKGEREQLGARGLEMIRNNGGATARHLEEISALMPHR